MCVGYLNSKVIYSKKGINYLLRLGHLCMGNSIPTCERKMSRAVPAAAIPTEKQTTPSDVQLGIQSGAPNNQKTQSSRPKKENQTTTSYPLSGARVGMDDKGFRSARPKSCMYRSTATTALATLNRAV